MSISGGVLVSEPTSPRRSWAILAVILLADIMDLIDATITNIAAPTISRDLGGGSPLIQWLGASYALSLGMLLVVGGRLGDRYGRRRLFLIGVTGFTLASIACGLALSPAMIIVARLVQGAFGALLIPQGFGILGSVFPRDELGKVFSVFAPVMGLSAVGAPILGGLLISADIAGLGWRSIFLINIILGGVALTAAIILLPKDSGESATVIDRLGTGLLAGSMLGLISGMIGGAANGWSVLAMLELAGGIVFFVLFCLRQRQATHPLIEPSLLRNRGFTSGLVVALAFFAGVSGFLYVVSIFLQNGLGHSPLDTAIAMTPMAIGIVIASFVTARLIARLGRTLVLVGLLVALASIGWLLALVAAAGTNVGTWALVPPFLLTGLGMGAAFGTILDVAIGDISPHEAGSASGSLSAIQQLATAIGAAAVTTVFFQMLGVRGHANALIASLLAVAALILLGCGFVWLMPRRAQTADQEVAVSAEAA